MLIQYIANSGDCSRSHDTQRKMPPTTPNPREVSVATLLRRAHGRSRPDGTGALSPQTLLATQPVPEKQATLTAQQRLIQQIYDTQAQALHHPQAPVRSYLDPFETDDAIECNQTGSRVEDDSIAQLLNELFELREALGPDEACLSTAERQYLRLLHESIVASVSSQVIASVSEPHTVDNRATLSTGCEALLMLSVKPSALSREIAFSLLYDVTHTVSLWSTMSISHASGHPHATSHPLSRLFGFCVDMLTKSVAVASSSTPASHPNDFPIQSPEFTWMMNAANCLTAFLKQSGERYRQDRLVKLDASTLSFLLRTAFSFTTASSYEAELQEQIVEIVVCSLYAQHEAKQLNTSRKSLASTPDHSEIPISLADVDKIGGLDLLLAIFYTTRSEASRRLLLVVLFDLTLDQLKNSKKRESEEAWSPSYNSLLKCLHDADFASLVNHTPLCFATAPDNGRSQDHSVASVIHAAVENELLDKHVVLLWSALQATLQVEEYFIHSASLANAIAVTSHATTQQTHTHESLAELIVGKAHQLIISSRMEDRFKGERWLAELLVYRVAKGNAAQGNERLLAASQGGDTDDPMEETFCFDEGAEIRLCARTKLWELAKSPSVAKRLAFAHVLSLFTRRRLQAGAAKSVVVDHLRELQLCVNTLVSAHEQSVAVLATTLQTLLYVVVSFQEISSLDSQRLKYDTESCDSPLEVVGALVGSDSLASKILCGVVALDLALVAEIPLEFLLHCLAVFDATLHCSSNTGCQGVNCGVVASQAGDYAAATALLVSHVVGFHASRETTGHPSPQVHSLTPYLDACDTRIAVIMARAVIVQLKRELGDRPYLNIVRELHAAAVDRDDESSLANEVAHARAVLHYVTHQQPTP